VPVSVSECVCVVDTSMARLQSHIAELLGVANIEVLVHGNLTRNVATGICKVCVCLCVCVLCVWFCVCVVCFVCGVWWCVCLCLCVLCSDCHEYSRL